MTRPEHLGLKAAAGALALAVMAVVATGFGSSGAQLKRGTIKVGYGNNLTGFLAVHDKLISDGARLAVEQINAKGGIGGKVKLKLILKDTKSDPAVSVQVANELIAEGVTALVLPCNTGFQVAMAAVAKRKKQFTLSPCNADPKLPKSHPIYWPVGMGGNAQGAQLGNYVKSRGFKRAYILDSDFLYIRLMTKYFEKAAPSRGIRIVGKDQVQVPNTGDFSAQVTKIKNARPRPDVIMTGLFTPFVVSFIRELRSQGVQTPVVGTDGMDTRLMQGNPTLNGTGFTTFGFPTARSATATFYSQYAKRFGKRPDGSFAALGAEAIRVLEAAVLKANSTSPRAIQEALGRGMTVRGALGPIVYPGRGEHNPVDQVAVVRIKAGKFSLVRNDVPKQVPAP